MSALWTCGIKRKLTKRSQIDFVAVSTHIDGTCRPLNYLDVEGEEPLHKKMDHRPVVAELRWLSNIKKPEVSEQPLPSLPKRTVHDAGLCESFRRFGARRERFAHVRAAALFHGRVLFIRNTSAPRRVHGNRTARNAWQS